MNKMFLTFLILFSNGTRTSTDNEKISGAFDSCLKGDVALCAAAISGTFAVTAAGCFIFNKGYNLIKDIVLLIRSKILIKNFQKILDRIEAENSTLIEKSIKDLLKDDVFQKTDLWLAINTLKELSENFKGSISSISANMSLADIKETVVAIKNKVDMVLAQKSEDLSLIAASAISIKDNLVAGKDELKWIFDRSQKIDDVFSIKDEAEIAKLKVVLENLKINRTVDNENITGLNKSVNDFILKIKTDNEGSKKGIKLTDMQEFLEQYNTKFKAMIEEERLGIVTDIARSKITNFDKILSDLTEKVNQEIKAGLPKEEVAEINLASSFAKIIEAVADSKQNYFEKYEEILKLIEDPAYKIIPKINEELHAKLVMLINNYINQNIINFKNNFKEKLIILGTTAIVDDTILTPEDQLVRLLNNNSKESLEKILNNGEFKKILEIYAKKKSINESFFKREIKDDQGKTFTIYDLFKIYETKSESLKDIFEKNIESEFYKAKIVAEEAARKEVAKQDAAARVLQEAFKRQRAQKQAETARQAETAKQAKQAELAELAKETVRKELIAKGTEYLRRKQPLRVAGLPE